MTNGISTDTFRQRAVTDRLRSIYGKRKANQMNWDQIEGDWKQFKGKVQQQWGKLTDDDIDVVNGKRTELLGLLQTRYGHDKEQSERAVDEWLKQIRD